MAHQPDDTGAGRRQLRKAPAAHPRVELDVDGNAVGHERRTRRRARACPPARASTSPCSAGPRTRIRAPGSARRSSSASATVATPSAVAPESSAAAPTGTAPCPYPSALTTAQSSAAPVEAGAEQSRVVADRAEVDRDEGPHHLRHSGEAVILRPHASRNGLDDAGSVLGAAYGAATSRKVGAMLLCRIGVHRWSFDSRQVDDQDTSTHTEIVFARCRRKGCRHGAWAVVNVDVYAAAKAPAAARAFATRMGQERPLSA